MRTFVLTVGVVLLMGSLGLAVALVVSLLAGCVSISGPCELRVEGDARVLACQPGGAVFMMPPSILDKLTRKEVPRDPPTSR
jgi:hypothetical protein